MSDLDIGAIREKYLPELLPTDQRYSVVEIDTFKPPSSPEMATKWYETDDDLEDIPVAAPSGIHFLAYDAEGNAWELPVESGADADQ